MSETMRRTLPTHKARDQGIGSIPDAIFLGDYALDKTSVKP